MKLDVRLKKIRSCIVLKDATAKNFVANEHHSFTFVFTFSVVVVDLPIDCILSFLFPSETDVLALVFAHSTNAGSRKLFNHCNVTSSIPHFNNLYSKPLCGT